MMRSILTAYVTGKKRTLKYEFAIVVLGVWVIFTIRLLISRDVAWISAQAGNYSTITWAGFAFVAAAVGLQTWQNNQRGIGGTMVTSQIDDGEAQPEPSPEAAARSVI